MNQDPQMAHEKGTIGLSDLLDLLYAVSANWRLLSIGPLVVGVVVLLISFMIEPTYTARTNFLPPQQQSGAAALLQSIGALGGLAGPAVGLKNPSDQYIAFLKSRTLQEGLITRFGLTARYQARSKDGVHSSLTDRTNINTGKDGLITIEVEDQDPSFAAQLANAHVEELNKLLGHMAVTEAQQRRQFFEKQLLQTKENLTKAELALRNTGIDPATLKNNPAVAVASVARLQAEIAAQEVKLASMRGYVTPSAPEFKKVLAELAALKSQGEKIALSTQQSEAGDADYVARYRDVRYHEILFELFARQFELAKVDESREGSAVQVLDRAQPPDHKSKPKKALMAVGATVLSAFILLLFVLSRQALRIQAKNPEMAEKMSRLRTAWR